MTGVQYLRFCEEIKNKHRVKTKKTHLGRSALPKDY